MPAEKVYGQQTAPDGAADARPQVPIVDVRWNREGSYVQIVTKATNPFGGRWLTLEEEPGTHVTDGLYVNLDRQGINRLIRNLRRARDQAFGRDE